MKRVISSPQVIMRLANYAFQIMAGLTLVVHFNSDRSDFRLFYDSAKEFLERTSPWNIQTHAYGNAYLNDPITLWLLSPLTLLEYENALLVFRIANVVLAIILINTVVKGKNLVISTLGAAFFLTSVAIRSNLEYGALGFLAFAIWLAALNLIKQNQNLWLAGSLLAYTSMFKPQLYLINILIILFNPKKVFAGFFVTGMASIGITSQFLGRNFILDWIEAIKLRAKIAETDNLQMDLACLLRILGVDSKLAYLMYAMLAATLALAIIKSKRLPAVIRKPELVLLAATSLSIFLHPTDLSIAAFLILITLFQHREITLKTLGAVSLLTVWSNSILFSLISGTLLICIYIALTNETKLRKLISAAGISSLPILFAYATHIFPEYENFLRNLLNYGGLLALTIILIAREIGKSDSRIEK